MLDGMRKASQTLIGKAILTIAFGLIIVSFVIWGVGDFIRGAQVTEVARVGKIDIDAQTYRLAFQTELQRLQRANGRIITNEQARAAGLDREVLMRLIGEAALDQTAIQYGLVISDSQAAAVVMEDPAFKGPTGAFDRQRFDMVLRQNDLNEREFLREQRLAIMRQTLIEGLVGKMETPALVVEGVNRFQNETRSVEYFTIKGMDASAIAEPPEDVLRKFFNERADMFAAPEYRKITILTLTPEQIARLDAISDVQAQQYYDQVKSERFVTPERRHVEQMTFPSKDEAAAALAKLKDGATFEGLAQERGLSAKDLDLGLVTRKQMSDSAVGEAVFTLPLNEIGGPIAGAFGYVLARVTQIQPESQKPYAEVSTALKKELALKKAAKDISALHDKVEEARSAGKPLLEAATAANLQAQIIAGVDRQGFDQNGVPVASMVSDNALLSAIFNSDVGIDNETLTTRDGGYKWFEINSIEPAHDRTFEEARDKVVSGWREDFIRRQLQERALAFVKRIREGADFASLATEAGAKVEQNSNVKRGGAQGIDPSVIVQIFNEPDHGSGSAAVRNARVIFKILDSHTPDFDPDKSESKQIEKQLRRELTESLITDYVESLKRELGVTIREAMLRQASGAEP